MSGAWDRPVERAARLVAGCVLFGLGIALLVQAELGVDPWTVFAQGVAENAGLSLGTVVIITSLVVLALWFPLHQRPGLGTLTNALLVGPVIDLGVALIPVTDRPGWQAAYVLGALVIVAIGSGLYIGAGWGPGPRDGLMTGLADLGVPIAVGRTAIEVTVLVLGWLLGGTVGIGTAVFALGIGPCVSRALPLLSVRPRTAEPAGAR